MLDKQKISEFRVDFQKTITQLEKDYGINITLGTISFNANEFRTKMTAHVGNAVPRASKEDFSVGDTVKINHKSIQHDDQFKIIKINAKNIKVIKLNAGEGRNGGEMTVSPGLLIKLN